MKRQTVTTKQAIAELKVIQAARVSPLMKLIRDGKATIEEVRFKQSCLAHSIALLKELDATKTKKTPTP